MKNRVFLLVAVCSLLIFLTADLALAEWQISCDAEAHRVLLMPGETMPRLHFATKEQCQAFLESQTGFVRRHCRCVGFDTPSSTPRRVTPQPRRRTITWPALEAKYFAEADQKGWTQIWIASGPEKRYYRKENGNWVRKSSEAEAKHTIPEEQRKKERWAKEERERELEREKELFELGKSNLLKTLKGAGGEQGLALKPAPKDGRLIVKSFKPIEVPVPRLHPNDFKKSPVISAEDSPLIRLPKLPEIREWVRKEVEKIPSKIGELAITAVGAEEYLKVFKIGIHLKDEAIRQMDKFMNLARRGFPEDEVSAFESEQQWRPYEIITEDLTDFPATAYQEYGTVEENEAQSWFWKPLF